MKEWRSNWRWSRFVYVLVLGLGASLFDSLTDFNFAWSVPEDCRNTTNSSEKPFDKDYNNWTSETREHLWTASISVLVVRILAFVLTFLTILFEDKVVASIVSKFPKQSKKKEEA